MAASSAVRAVRSEEKQLVRLIPGAPPNARGRRGERRKLEAGARDYARPSQAYKTGGIDAANRAAYEAAAAYLSCLYDPFNCGVGIGVPDILSIPTCTLTSYTRFQVSSVPFGDGTYQVVLTVSPIVGAGGGVPKITVATAYAGGVASAETQLFDAELGGANGPMINNFGSYRTVGMGVRLIPSAPLLSRGGTVAAALIPFAATGMPPTAPTVPDVVTNQENFALIQACRDVAEFDLADTSSARYEFAWHPGNYHNLDLISPTASGGVGEGDPMRRAPYILMGYMSGNASESATVEVVTHYEATPYQSTAAMFSTDRKSVV